MTKMEEEKKVYVEGGYRRRVFLFLHNLSPVQFLTTLSRLNCPLKRGKKGVQSTDS